MKKALTLSVFGLAMGASSLMAAYQYGDYVDYKYGENLSDSTLTVVQDSSLTLNFLTNPYYSPQGYTITDWSTLSVQITDSTGQQTYRDVAISGSSVDIGDFMAGDSLFFYVSGDQGSTSTTVQSHIGHEGWDTTTSTPDSLFFDGNYGNWNSQYAQLSFRVDGSAQSPTGQPLPGAAVSILLGSAGLYWIKRKKTVPVAC
ncbi:MULTISPECIES: hypothetical protein [unclassified Lentimonas]|uniref:hypothetical protein n=1 Tax=unclassified Lentimonas TaxID=2630993 RepID=UPI00132B6823|nr:MULTISPECIES: hypothetical protein [unclassified Lentimonas]CAA6677589.1 Unannotated [Lentimonas sp. CC4]CAA6684313.1 Unannotated [Lentimonas sp. CC6]CAA7078168.1 Unannotated [Lentimonas sp. CC4]CAA7168314.1 Unannotated [Lentimonas sp. CC21]CAA7181853.1 Unannotated [Lentimonas sp. CC8]